MKNICSRTGKNCYTQKEAGDLLRIAKKKTQRSSVIPKRSYYCKHCGYFHLTSKSDSGAQELHRPIKLLNPQEEFDLSEVL